MTSETDFRNLTDEQRFELLEHPEAWPDDPALQAELAELLELHLALGAHGDQLRTEVLVTARWQLASRPTWLAAAVAVLALLPAGYAYQRVNSIRTQASHRSHLEADAQRRTQERLWADFFTQTSMVIKDFQQNPKACATRSEDRSEEREAAILLRDASIQLAAQGNMVAEAQQVRANLHAWLQELAMEDPCLNPQRADELRRWASAGKLGDQAERMGRLLRGEGS